MATGDGSAVTRWLTLALAVGTLLCACPAPQLRETCGDGLDNDGNGLIDCDDLDCRGQPACVAPDYGLCAKCSLACAAQPTCVTSYLDERPIPLCTEGRCTALATFIQPRIELDTTAWAGVTYTPQSAATRFIRKTTQDGSAVSCTQVLSIASNRDMPGAIEASQKLVILGLDVTPVTNFGQRLVFSLVTTQTASDYLVWIELWGGPRNTTTKLPSGRRLGYGCFETLPTVAPLVPQDNCPSTTSDAGTCRTFRLVMPPPE